MILPSLRSAQAEIVAAVDTSGSIGNGEIGAFLAEIDALKGQLRARVWFGPETEGPPGHAHGGSIAAILDEVLGLAAWTAGYPIVVGNLNVSFRNLLPLQHVVTVKTEIVSAEGRKIKVHGSICLGDTVFATGEALCITIPGR